MKNNNINENRDKWINKANSWLDDGESQELTEDDELNELTATGGSANQAELMKKRRASKIHMATAEGRKKSKENKLMNARSSVKMAHKKGALKNKSKNLSAKKKSATVRTQVSARVN